MVALECERGLHGEPNRVLELAMGGDAAALDRLFAPCIPRLRKVAARLLYNEQDSEDALQDGLLSAFRHLNQFRGRAQFTTWVHSIVVNAARSELRKQRLRPYMQSLDEPLTPSTDLSLKDKVVDSHSSLDEHYARTEKRRILAEAIATLPPVWRAVLRMYDSEGMRVAEIAARLGVSSAAVKSRRFRANRRIRTWLRKRARGQSHQGTRTREPDVRFPVMSARPDESTKVHRRRTPRRNDPLSDALLQL